MLGSMAGVASWPWVVETIFYIVRSKDAGKMSFRGASSGSSFALWVADAQDSSPTSSFLFAALVAVCSRAWETQAHFVDLFFFWEGEPHAPRYKRWRVLGQCPLKGLSQLSHLCQLLDLSLDRWILNWVKQPTSRWTTIVQPPAATAAYVTSEKHPTAIWWVRGVAEGGHGMSQAGKHLLRRGVGILSAHFEPWEMRWNSREQIVCE